VEVHAVNSVPTAPGGCQISQVASCAALTHAVTNKNTPKRDASDQHLPKSLAVMSRFATMLVTANRIERKLWCEIHANVTVNHRCTTIEKLVAEVVCCLIDHNRKAQMRVRELRTAIFGACPKDLLMNDIRFAAMVDLEHEVEVLAMMDALYGEDAPAAAEVDRSRFPVTIRTLIAEPHRGRVILFMDGSTVRGYALLIPIWSNEFGGTVVLIDELFVKPQRRRQGIGGSFLRFVLDSPPFDAVAAVLEVSPTNDGARRLYESVGFIRRRNATYTCRLA
jgi:GNAT superfamily N-acetyltransferase